MTTIPTKRGGNDYPTVSVPFIGDPPAPSRGGTHDVNELLKVGHFKYSKLEPASSKGRTTYGDSRIFLFIDTIQAIQRDYDTLRIVTTGGMLTVKYEEHYGDAVEAFNTITRLLGVIQ